WANYDGDFFTPGSPENGFGIQVGSTNYSNNASNLGTVWSAITQLEIPGTLSNYQVIGDCISVEWNGSVANIGVKIVYHLIVTELFYTTEVTLTNNTGATVNDLYYYRNLDPDNNVFLNGQYSTQNTVVSQGSGLC